KWVSDWYDKEATYEKIAQILSPLYERDRIIIGVAEGIQDVIKIKKSMVGIATVDKLQQIESYTLLTKDQGKTGDLSISDPLIYYLNNNKVPVIISNMPAEIRERVLKLGFDKKGLLIPLYTPEALEGFIIYDQRISQAAYNKHDLALFKTLSGLVKVFLDRMRPYERIKADYEKTEKKQVDAERNLARSERITSISTIIREYNHEIRHPLAIIKGETQEIIDENLDQTKQKEKLQLLIKHVNRMEDIINATSRLYTPREKQYVPLDLSAVLDAAFAAVDFKGVQVIKENIYPGLMTVGDFEDLKTVFINLFKNAVEAMPEGGRLTVTFSKAEYYGEPYIQLDIADTGVGIPSENYERIFEPFFSTNVTKGRGLGLSIVHRIVREHLGYVSVESRVGFGSTFTIKLTPAA
ncbi:MAG: ATP-binding protein, partial [Candidatus Margulisbacteria bacterium]|nr:ATP-binding protein [Candidatus Margulisiibacteriota bacterium]